jgi:hypothetical protein
MKLPPTPANFPLLQFNFHIFEISIELTSFLNFQQLADIEVHHHLRHRILLQDKSSFYGGDRINEMKQPICIRDFYNENKKEKNENGGRL